MTSGSLSTGMVVTACALACLGAGPAVASNEFVPGEVIVRYSADSSPADRTTARESSEVGSSAPLLLPDAQVVETDPGQSVRAAIADLENDPTVLYAEPNYIEQPDAVPNDPFLPNLWGDLNAGQTVNGIAGTAGADISAREGWDIARTSPEVITAVLDSGITRDHPDLSNQIWDNPGEIANNGVDDDNNGLIDDLHGWDFVNGDREPADGEEHGTHVAGIIGATGNNGYGITGVSWDANLMPLQVCLAQGGCPVAAMVNAIGYADRMGARVANISVGGKTFSSARRDAIAAADDTLFITSAGNEANDLPAGQGDNDTVSKYPCMDDQEPGYTALKNVICVASTDQSDFKSNFSNWGATSVDLAAPGSNVLSTIPTFIFLYTDTFDTLNANWNYAKVDQGAPALPNGWERNIGIGATDRGVTDSLDSAGNQINYAPGSNASTTMTTGVNLSERDGCRLQYNYRVATEQPTPNSFTGADVFYVEAANSASGPWTVLDRWAGNSGGYLASTSRGSQASLEPFAKNGPVFIRFRLQADADANVGAGAVVDDVRMRCAGASSPGVFQYLNGTSMSAPQVSGIASLVRQTNPGLSPAEVKTKILGGVDVIPALNAATGSPTPVVSGGRANLFKTLSSLDRTPPPVPQLLKPAGPVANSARPEFTWTANQADANYVLALDGQVVAAGKGLSSFTPSEDLRSGSHSWFVQAIDHPGNIVTSEIRNFNYVKNKLKILSVKPVQKAGGAVARARISESGTLSAVARIKYGSGKRRKPWVVARGFRGYSRGATVKLGIRLNQDGIKILRKKNQKKVVAKITFTFKPTSKSGRAVRNVNARLARRG